MSENQANTAVADRNSNFTGRLISYDQAGIANVIGVMERLHGTTTIALPKHYGADIQGMLAVIPSDMQIVDLKEHIDAYKMEQPDRIVANTKVTTEEALTLYLNRFKTKDAAVIFVNDSTETPFILGVLDYHEGVIQGKDGVLKDGVLPSFCTHKVTYSMPVSDAFKLWMATTKGGLMTQEAFANFLGDRIQDIDNPPLDWTALEPKAFEDICELLNIHDDKGTIDDSSLTLVDDESNDSDSYIPRSAVWKLRQLRWGNQQRLAALARGIEVSTASRATSAYDVKTGSKQVSFQEETGDARDRAGRKIAVPDVFLIYIPIFEGGTRMLMPVRLFYRVKADKVMWGIEVIDHRRMVRNAVSAVADRITMETGTLVLFGRPD